MTRLFEIHPVNPQPRLIRGAATVLRDGGLIAYPTDSCYAFGWLIGYKNPLETVMRLRRTDKAHVFTLVCRDLSDIATYAKVDNAQYRLLRVATPGPFTLVLEASRELPRRLHNPRRRTVGIRVPDNAIAQALLAELETPMMSSTLSLPGYEFPLADAEQILTALPKALDGVIDGGACGIEPTTVVDLTVWPPEVIRHGRGEPTWLAG